MKKWSLITMFVVVGYFGWSQDTSISPKLDQAQAVAVGKESLQKMSNFLGHPVPPEASPVGGATYTIDFLTGTEGVRQVFLVDNYGLVVMAGYFLQSSYQQINIAQTATFYVSISAVLGKSNSKGDLNTWIYEGKTVQLKLPTNSSPTDNSGLWVSAVTMTQLTAR